jgi:hypothetical protein
VRIDTFDELELVGISNVNDAVIDGDSVSDERITAVRGVGVGQVEETGLRVCSVGLR